MIHLKDEIIAKFELNKQHLLESQVKYGGGYIARIFENDEKSAYYNSLSLEVEVSDGTIAFSIFIESEEFEAGGSTPDD